MPAGLSGWHLVIILIIVLLLFGAPRLPKLAKSLGESMRIFRGEVRNMNDEADEAKAQRKASNAETPSTEAGRSDATPTDSDPGSTPR